MGTSQNNSKSGEELKVSGIANWLTKYIQFRVEWPFLYFAIIDGAKINFSVINKKSYKAKFSLTNVLNDY